MHRNQADSDSFLSFVPIFGLFLFFGLFLILFRGLPIHDVSAGWLENNKKNHCFLAFGGWIPSKQPFFPIPSSLLLFFFHFTDLIGRFLSTWYQSRFCGVRVITLTRSQKKGLGIIDLTYYAMAPNPMQALEAKIEERFAAMEQRSDSQDQRFAVMEKRIMNMEDLLKIISEKLSTPQGVKSVGHVASGSSSVNKEDLLRIISEKLSHAENFFRFYRTLMES